MTISYAITVKDEIVEIKKLIEFLLKHKRKEDEIVVVYDSNNGSKIVEDYLRHQTVTQNPFMWYPFKFEGHFAALKNFLTLQCNNDYIFQIDADEMPHERLRRNLLNIKIDGSNTKSITKYIIPQSWNNLNSEIKEIPSISKFKKVIKKNMLQNYSNIEICSLNTCNICK